MNGRKKHAGFTLIEVVFVSALMAIFSLFIVNLAILSRNAWQIEQSSSSVRNESKRGMEAMLKELRQTSLTNPNGITISNGNARISFALPNQVSQAGIQSWRPVEYSYDAAAQELVRTENGANASVLARQIQSLQFTRAGNVISTTIVSNGTTANGTSISSTLTSQVRMRN